MSLVSDATMRALSPDSRMGRIMKSQVLKMGVDKFDEIIYQCTCIKTKRQRDKPKAELKIVIQKALNVMTPDQCDEMVYQISILKKARLEQEKREKKDGE